MSRCFSYPPPYCQDALIDSIKLQKEKEKALAKLEKKEKKKAKKEEKKRQKERKKEETKERNEKLDNGDGASQDSKHILPKEIHRKRKFAENLLSEKESQCNFGNEGSGVTEERGSPCSIHHNFESSESSQDSTKRKKLLAPVQIHNSSVLRFKLPVPRPENSDLMKNFERVSPIPVSVQSDLAMQKKAWQKEGMAVDFCEPRRSSKIGRKPDLSSDEQNNSIPKPSSSFVIRQKDKEFKKTVPLSFLPRHQKAEQIGAGKLELKVDGADIKSELQPRISLSFARLRGQEPAKCRKDFDIAGEKNGECESTHVAGHRQAPDMGLKSQVEEVPCTSDQAYISGQITTVAQKVEFNRSNGSRSDVENFSEIILNWKPSSLGFSPAYNSDEDWLCRDSEGQSSSHINKCEVDLKALSSVGSCTASLQPQASYMPELNMFMMPYAIPF